MSNETYCNFDVHVITSVSDRVFGCHLSTLCEREGTTVPKFVKICLDAVDKRGMFTNGLELGLITVLKSLKHRVRVRGTIICLDWFLSPRGLIKHNQKAKANTLMCWLLHMVGSLWVCCFISCFSHSCVFVFSGLQVDGIYRVSGNLATIQKLRFIVDQGRSNTNLLFDSV